MVAFRKLFPVLAVGALSVASALAQNQTNSTALVCQANSGVPPVVRAEGLTELLGDLVINCTGGNPAQTITTNIQIFLNTNVTSRLASDGATYDALLMIDEPGAARLDVNGATSSITTPFCPVGTAAATCNPAAGSPGAATGVTFQQGTNNVFRGTRPQVSSDNSIVWTGVPIVPPGSNRVRTIRITNVRGNASSIGATSSGLPNQIIAFISANPQGTLPIDNPQQTVGYVQQGLLFDVRNCGNTGGRGSSVGGFQCQSRNADRYNTPTSGSLPSNSTTNDTVVGLRFREGFQTAFKTRIATGQTTSLPGQVFNTESGFVNVNAVPNGLGDVTTGVADTGTRLRAVFNNVPTNVRIFVSTSQVASLSGAAQAVLVTTDPNGASSFAVAAGAAPPTAPPASITVNCSGVSVNSGTNAVEVPITSGTGQAVWEVVAADQNSLDTLVFHAAYAYVANANAGQPGLGSTTVTGTFAPIYTASNAGTATFAPAVIPRFVAGSAAAQAFFSISSCSTNLLFPFVTNQAGFDTGIAIANTSQDPFSSSNQNAGTCVMNYYGSLPNNAPLTTTSETTSSAVPAGQTLTMVLSTGGNFGLKGNPNMQGYIIAQCNFRFAHGFAFITDGPIGQARVAEGYLAIVLDGVNTIRGNSNGEEQAH